MKPRATVKESSRRRILHLANQIAKEEDTEQFRKSLSMRNHKKERTASTYTEGNREASYLSTTMMTNSEFAPKKHKKKIDTIPQLILPKNPTRTRPRKQNCLSFSSVPKLTHYIINNFVDEDSRDSLAASKFKMDVTERSIRRMEKNKIRGAYRKSLQYNEPDSTNFYLDLLKKKNFLDNIDEAYDNEYYTEREVKKTLDQHYKRKMEEKLLNSRMAYQSIRDYFQQNEYEPIQDTELINENNLRRVIKVTKILKKKDQNILREKNRKMIEQIEKSAHSIRNMSYTPSNVKKTFKIKTQVKFNKLRGVYLGSYTEN